MQPEQRRSRRAPVELRVVYERWNSFFADYTKDISKGGLFVQTDAPLALGTYLEFQVTLPDAPRAVRLHGQVVWVTRREDAHGDQVCGMGIHLLWKSDAAREEFEKMVERLMAERSAEV